MFESSINVQVSVDEASHGHDDKEHREEDEEGTIKDSGEMSPFLAFFLGVHDFGT